MLPLSRHGLREMTIGTIILVAIGLGLYAIYKPLALIIVPVLIWLFAFFRDPERPIPADNNIMVSPADGVVTDIIELEHSDSIGGPVLRIGIFLSVFNVHVNRAPCAGTVKAIQYKNGKFLSAMSHAHASEHNESNTIVLHGKDGRPVAAVKQIAGLIARRIICTVAINDSLERGERFGMIKFGSRTELYIPRYLVPQAAVKTGQKIRGGRDIIARLSVPTGVKVEMAAASGR
jgi:phosphatidylserine decarboxylase